MEADPACRCRSPVFLTQTAARSGPRLAESISSSRWGRRPLQAHPGGSQTKQPGSAASEAMPRANGVAQKARRPWKRPFLSSTGRGAVFLFGQVPKRKIGGRITQFLRTGWSKSYRFFPTAQRRQAAAFRILFFLFSERKVSCPSKKGDQRRLPTLPPMARLRKLRAACLCPGSGGPQFLWTPLPDR